LIAKDAPVQILHECLKHRQELPHSFIRKKEETKSNSKQKMRGYRKIIRMVEMGKLKLLISYII
jgi:hypothetical protein